MKSIKEIFNNLSTFDKIILIVITLVMANNVEHLAWVHYSIARHALGSVLLNKIHSILVVVIVELAIMAMVFKGEEGFAGLYTFFLLALSLIYYPLKQYWINGEWEKFIAAIIFSLMFTLSIWYFARVAAKRKQDANEVEQYLVKYGNAARELAATKATVNTLRDQLEQFSSNSQKNAATETEATRKLQQLEKELHELRQYKKQVTAACTCRYCNTVFESEASKRSHEGKCKTKEIKEAA